MNHSPFWPLVWKEYRGNCQGQWVGCYPDGVVAPAACSAVPVGNVAHNGVESVDRPLSSLLDSVTSAWPQAPFARWPR